MGGQWRPKVGDWIHYLDTCRSTAPARVLEVAEHEIGIFDVAVREHRKLSTMVGMWPITSLLEVIACEAVWAEFDAQ